MDEPSPPGDAHDPDCGQPPRWGRACGCLAAACFALPTTLAVAVALTIGECWPARACHRHGARTLLVGFALVLALTILMGIVAGKASAQLPPRLAASLFWLAVAAALALFVLTALT